MRRSLLASLLVAASGQALALVPPAGVIEPTISPTGRVVNWVSAANGTWSPGGAGSGAIVSTVGKDFAMPGPGGRAAAARMTIGFTARDIALGAGRALGVIGLAAWAGSELYDYYTGFRVAPNTTGSPLYDNGTNEVEADVWAVGAGTTPHVHPAFVGGSAGAVLGQFVGFLNSDFATVGSLRNTWAAGVCTGGAGYADCYVKRGQCFAGAAPATCTPPAAVNYEVVRIHQSTDDVCPAYVDFSGNNIGQGVAAPGFDNKCPSGTYEPITPEQLADIRTSHENAYNPGNLNDLTAEILGRVPMPVTEDGSVAVGNVVPSTLAGPVKVTTKVENGETLTTTEAIGWDWGLDPLRGNEGNWIPTKSVLVKDAAGNTISETTETESGQTAADAEESVINQCVLNPNASGCAKFGVAPASPVLETKVVALSITPLGGFGPSDSACPAPRTATLAGGFNLSMPFDLLCDFANGIRPIVVGLAWVSAVFAFMGISRKAS